MPDTWSRSSQEQPLRIVDDSTLWAYDPTPNPLAAVAALTFATLTIAPPAQVPGTSSRVDQAPGMTADWRAELKARYKAMPKTSWFKAAHEGRSLGGPIKIS